MSSSGCGCGKKDQTPEAVVKFLGGLAKKNRGKRRADLRQLKGTGIFLVPAPELGVLEYKRVLVGDLQYDECSKRAANCEAFQWIPIALKSKSEIEVELKDRDCFGEFCQFNHCFSIGCFCNDMSNFCRPF